MYRIRLKGVSLLMILVLVLVCGALGGSYEAASSPYLQSLSISNGTLNGAFNPTTLVYTANANDLEFTVTAVPSSSNAIVKVNGETLSSTNGYTSSTISLYNGSHVKNTTIPIQVSSSSSNSSGNVQYSLTVIPITGPSSEYLSSLSISGGTLSPSFNRTTTSYTSSIDASSFTVTAVPEDANAIVYVDGQTLSSSSGYVSQAISVNPGTMKSITIRVAVPGGNYQDYYVAVMRTGNTSTYLSSLYVSGASLSPSFSKTTNSYTASTNASSITVTAIPESASANVTVEGQSLASSNGYVSQPIYLNSGNNEIEIRVFGSWGSVNSYYINVYRQDSHASTYLSSLSISGASLSPSFYKTTLTYTATTSASSVTITAVPENPNVTVTVEGQKLSGYNWVSQPIYLTSAYINRIDIQVYNPANGDYNNYWIDVYHDSPGSAYLSSLSISGASLSPSFSKTTTAYTAYANASSVTVTAIPENNNSTVTIDGQTVSYGSARTVYLGSGTTRIYIQVYNPSWGYTNYYIDVTRGYYNNNSAYLSSLYISGASLDQSFYRTTNSYTATTNASSVTVTAVPENTDATVTVEGQRLYNYNWVSQPIYLSSGTNRIDIQVYNPSTGAYNNYWIDITRGGGSNGYIETYSATNISASSATLNARINSNNYKDVDAYGFSYSTNQSNWKLVTVAYGDITGAYSKVLKNLQPNTRYYYRAFMWNSRDYYTYGSTVSFYTTTTDQGVEVPIVRVDQPNTISSFWDVPSSHWAYNNINNLVRLGYMTGYPDSSFHPGYGMSRAEVASVMAQILNIGSYDTSIRHFYDVAPGDWYYAPVEKAYQKGIISGQGGYFSPNRATTREELAQVLVKALGKQSEAQASMNERTGFSDDSSISSSARGYVAVAVRYGLITGYNNRFNPKNSVTRAEVSSMLTSFLNKHR